MLAKMPRSFGKANCDMIYTAYDAAVRIAVEYGSVNEGRLQRRLRIPFKRARELIERMEKDGIIGPANGSKYKEVII